MMVYTLLVTDEKTNRDLVVYKKSEEKPKVGELTTGWLYNKYGDPIRLTGVILEVLDESVDHEIFWSK